MKACLPVLCLLVAIPARAAITDVQLAPPYRGGEVIVKYRSSAYSTEAGTLKARLALNPRQIMLEGRAEVLELPSVMDVPDAVALLKDDPAVEYVEPNYLKHPLAFTPDDTYFSEQWGVLNTGQANFVAGGPAGTPGGDLHLIDAWDSDGNGTPDRTGTGAVTVAIVDSGFELTHEDLAANFIAGYDFANNDSNPAPTSSDPAVAAHGTEVAGALGAIGNNGKGVAGAIWNVKIMPLKFGFDTVSEINAFEYARQNGARIINASFGGPGFSQSELDEIEILNSAGVLLIAAAGNENSNTDFAGSSYPANYRAPNVIAAAATNRQDDIASFSTYGPTTVDVAAPGLQIITTTLKNTYTPMPGVSGTSFASPYTAGVAALIANYVPGADASQIRARLIEGADAGTDTANPVNQRVSGGRVNAANALNLAPRPALIIEPALTETYPSQFNSATAVPVYRPVTTDDGDSGVLTPGESVNLGITVKNLWQSATGVTGTLTADNGVTVNGGANNFGDLAQGATAVASFNISVPTSLSGHQYVGFTLALSANGGAYAATRHFTLEAAALSDAVPVTQAFGTTIYDEFHTWVFQVPAGLGSVTFKTTAANDIDLLVRAAQPAQYDIGIGVKRGSKNAPYYVNAPSSQLGRTDKSGNESVSINHPAAGPYFVTVVDFDEQMNTSYTLEASTSTKTVETGGGDSGGAFGPFALSALVLAAGARRRRITAVFRSARDLL